MLVEELRINKAADLVVDSAEPIAMDRAEAREKLWTPEGAGAGEGESGSGSGTSELWTPGDD